MVHRPELKEYVQRQKEYRQRQNRKYKQRRKRVSYIERNNRITNTIQNTGSQNFPFFFFSFSFFPVIIFSNVLKLIFLTSFFFFSLFNGLPRGPSIVQNK